MSTTIRFNAPAHHVLEVEGKRIPGGETAEVSRDVAEELATAPYADVTVLTEADLELERRGTDLERLKRDELDELASALGVENAGALPKKAAVIAAIKEAEAAREVANESEPEATGQGQNTEEKEA